MLSFNTRFLPLSIDPNEQIRKAYFIVKKTGLKASFKDFWYTKINSELVLRIPLIPPDTTRTFNLKRALIVIIKLNLSLKYIILLLKKNSPWIVERFCRKKIKFYFISESKTSPPSNKTAFLVKSVFLSAERLMIRDNSNCF